jgi:hypothetical protein
MVFPCGQVPVPDDELLFKAPMITKMGRRVRSKPSAKKGPRVKSKFAPIYPSWSLRRKEMELEGKSQHMRSLRSQVVRFEAHLLLTPISIRSHLSTRAFRRQHSPGPDAV